MNAKTIAFYFCFLLFEMVTAHTRHNALEMSEKQNEISFAFGWKFFGQTRESWSFGSGESLAMPTFTMWFPCVCVRDSFNIS